MSSAFNSSWFNYTAMPYRASMVIPGSGIATRQMDVSSLGGVNVPTLNVDKSVFEQGQFPEGLTNGVQNWQLPVRLPKNPEYEIGRGELTFVQYSARQSKVNDGTYQVRSLSRLNYHLMLPEMREAYGTKTSCEELMQLWTLYGIQQPQQPLHVPRGRRGLESLQYLERHGPQRDTGKQVVAAVAQRQVHLAARHCTGYDREPPASVTECIPF